MINSVVEKLAAIEKEVAAIQPKMAPLTERIADMDQKVAGFAQQLSGLATESAAIKQDIELTRSSLARIQTLIGESKVESEQLVAGQEENLQRCETMTAVFGAAFQAVSQFFATAQRMGLADQAKAIFLKPPSASEVSPPPPEDASPLSVAPASEPVVPEPLDSVPPMPELPIETEPALSESDFDAVLPNVQEEGLDSLDVPSLPDVAAPPEMAHEDMVSADSDAIPADAMASHLDVAPLNLTPPPLPEQSEPSTAEETDDDQEIEALLASMETPVTVAAGN
jgi:hypothetical protein